MVVPNPFSWPCDFFEKSQGHEKGLEIRHISEFGGDLSLFVPFCVWVGFFPTRPAFMWGHSGLEVTQPQMFARSIVPAPFFEDLPMHNQKGHGKEEGWSWGTHLTLVSIVMQTNTFAKKKTLRKYYEILKNPVKHDLNSVWGPPVDPIVLWSEKCHIV